jgi:molybdate-binding protein
VQRDPGASSQQALARAAAAAGELVPSGPVVSGHLDAVRLARQRGGVAVTYEPAAARFGLEFLPLETHVVEVWVADEFVGHPGMAELGELLAGRALRERLAAIGGYDLAEMGVERRAA